MPSTDYTSTGGGLKLKGAKDAGISKRKSKKSKKDKTASTAEPTTSTALEKASATPDPERIVEGEEGAQYDREKSKTIGVSRQGSSHADSTTRMKTEAEIRHEEMKRKRVCFLTTLIPFDNALLI